MRVVLTGASGFLGRAFTRVFLARGDEVLAIQRRLDPESPGLRMGQGDLGKPLKEGVFEGAGLVLHLAHDMRPGQEQRNVEGTTMWLEQAAREGVPRQVYFSTVSAHRRSPSEYGRSKFALETYAMAHRGGVVRLGLVIGDGGVFANLKAASCRGPLALALGGAGVRVLLTGLAELLDIVTEGRAPAAGEAVNIFSPEPMAMAELVARLRRFFGARGPVIPVSPAYVRLALAAGGALHPALKRYRESFLALLDSQTYGYVSSLPSLGIGARPLEAMLAAAFGPSRQG